MVESERIDAITTRPSQIESKILQALTSSNDTSDSATTTIRNVLLVTLVVFLASLSISILLLNVPLFNWVRNKYFKAPSRRQSFLLNDVSRIIIF